MRIAIMLTVAACGHSDSSPPAPSAARPLDPQGPCVKGDRDHCAAHDPKFALTMDAPLIALPGDSGRTKRFVARVAPRGKLEISCELFGVGTVTVDSWEPGTDGWIVHGDSFTSAEPGASWSTVVEPADAELRIVVEGDTEFRAHLARR
jgi:hypothetical protein